MSAFPNAFLVERGDRLRMTFSGAKAKEALGGLVTNDVVALTAGRGQRAVALTPKGRVIALLRVFDRGDDLLVDTEAASGDGFAAMIRKFVNPRLAKFDVVTDATDCLGVYGDASAAAVAEALGTGDGSLDALDALDALEPLAHRRFGEPGVMVLRSTDYAPPGFDLVGSPAAIQPLREALVRAGVAAVRAEAVEVARVEAGLPRFGVDMDAETIPQEANLDALGAISFNKGCYTGQEVVARIHFRGHVNRHLRWLTADEAMPSGAVVLDADGKEVGDVRSSVVSPLRGPLAIAMLRREVAPGGRVRVRSGDRELGASVEAIA